MTEWILLTATLAGVNLVRIWRHGLVLAGVMLATLALLALFAVAALQLLSMQANNPAAAGIWPWPVALLLLADPTTRLLRWGLEVMGKPYLETASPHGRGEVK